MLHDYYYYYYLLLLLLFLLLLNTVTNQNDKHQTITLNQTEHRGRAAPDKYNQQTVDFNSLAALNLLLNVHTLLASLGSVYR